MLLKLFQDISRMYSQLKSNATNNEIMKRRVRELGNKPSASKFSTTLFADNTYLVLVENNLLRLEHKVNFQLQLGR